MLVTCVSDIHGNLLPNLPKSDLLIIAGDLCPTFDHSIPTQEAWIKNAFYPWLRSQDIQTVVYVAGNHDFIYQNRPGLLKQYTECSTYHNYDNIQHIFYLQDDTVILANGIKIFGTPWQLPFFDWAFNGPEEVIAKALENMPKDTDIIISHGPPKFHGDRTRDGYDSGSVALLDKIKEIQPKLVVTGHIHEAYGEYTCQNTKIINASVLNRKYQLTNQPIQFTIEQTQHLTAAKT